MASIIAGRTWLVYKRDQLHARTLLGRGMLLAMLFGEVAHNVWTRSGVLVGPAQAGTGAFCLH